MSIQIMPGISAEGLFERWAAHRQSPSLGRRRLSDASVATLRWSWKSWCDYLQEQAVPWSEARPADVQHFLASLQGSRVRRVRLASGALQAQRPLASGVTRARYARILADLYASAVRDGLVASNPVTAEARTRDRGDSLVLHAGLWQRLADAAAAMDPPGWTGVRDRTLLLLMLQLGLTVGELRALALGDVGHACLRKANGVCALHQRELPGVDAGAPARLMIGGSRPQQPRHLSVPQPAAAALARWLQVRVAELPDAPRDLQSPLFVSRKGFAPLTAKTLFLVANTHISQVLQLPLPHAGPNALRNACIARWLEQGMNREQAAVLAGLTDAASLARLPSASATT